MHRGYSYFTSFVLTAALASPMAFAQQDDQRQHQDQAQQRDQRDQQQERNNNSENQQRVYDRSHHGYHQWNDNEDHAYRQYLAENHKDYRDFKNTSRRQQTKYWNWRHSHPDQGQQDNHPEHDSH